MLKPIFVILTSLSIIWDFQVFTQPFLLRQPRPDPDYWLMSIYAYEKSFGIRSYGLGSAIALVMLAIMLCLTFFYIRQMIRIGRCDDRASTAARRPPAPRRAGRRRVLLNLAGLVVFVVMIFPVYWMVSRRSSRASRSRATRRSGSRPPDARPLHATRSTRRRSGPT